ncbi:MAG TPA: zinc-binding dehydrogenase, partial [Blastocatellia bacterium]
RVEIGARTRVCVIGDGKLGQLIVRVLATRGCDITMAGKHDDKLQKAVAAGAKVVRVEQDQPVTNFPGKHYSFDVVVEASGSPSGADLALALVRPRGAVVLKSTHHDRTLLDLSRVVVNELTLVGSRCGRFRPAVELLEKGAISVRDMITGRFALDRWEEAFKTAAEPSSLKVVISM